MPAQMPSGSCPPPGLHRGLHPSHEACRQLVSSDPGLGHALEGAEAVLLLIEDYYNLLNDVLEEGLAELEPGNIAVQIFRGRRATLSSWCCWSRKSTAREES